jgi:hypothetical protein
MATLTVFVKGREVKFESSLGDVNAKLRLAELVKSGEKLEKNSFAQELHLKKLTKMSALQVAWVHKLVVDADAPPPPPVEAVKENLLGVIELFDAAAVNLKHPKISLGLKFGEVDFTVQLSRTGAGSKYGLGCVYVTDGVWGGRWYARIDREGNVTPSREITDEIRFVLAKLSLDPAKFAQEYGLKTGNCCFCNKHLDDHRSTAVGFGPVCAKKWGLKDKWTNFWKTVEAKELAGV